MKTKTKPNHTPGPWDIDRGSIWEKDNPPRPGHAICGVEKAFSSITIRALPDFMACPSKERLDEIGEANARLIAAAPETAAEMDRLKEINRELLEAVKFLIETSNTTKAQDKEIRALIAKAERVYE